MKGSVLLLVALICTSSNSIADDGKPEAPPEKAALEFTTAMVFDRDVERAISFFDEDAERKTAGRGSAVAAARREIPRMPPPDSLTIKEIHLFFQRTFPGSPEIDHLFPIETIKSGNDPFPGGELIDQFSLGVIEIQVVKPVPFTDPDEFIRIGWIKIERIFRLHVLFMFFFKKGADHFSCGYIIAIQHKMILVPVQQADINGFAVGRPGN